MVVHHILAMPHIHPLIDFTVGAFIVNNGRVALIHHKELKKWLSVGGHIELDEDPVVFKRRIKRRNVSNYSTNSVLRP